MTSVWALPGASPAGYGGRWTQEGIFPVGVSSAELPAAARLRRIIGRHHNRSLDASDGRETNACGLADGLRLTGLCKSFYVLTSHCIDFNDPEPGGFDVV
jgi:hypothetical protein